MDSKQQGMAPHVQAAVARSRGPAADSPLQASASPSSAAPAAHAAHVAAAIAAAGPTMEPPTGSGAVQTKSTGPLDAYAAHVQTAIQFKGSATESLEDAGAASFGDWVSYPEKKGMRIPPPPQKPVYSLSCGEKGEGCRLRSLENGRVQQAGTMFAGYVRMSKGGDIYVSPRTGVGNAGDSHPSIASMSPEWRAGQRAVVAGGEVGIIDGKIVGHNDKTGHFQTRKNLAQSGMPADRFHPFTEDARNWFKQESSGDGAEGAGGSEK